MKASVLQAQSKFMIQNEKFLQLTKLYENEASAESSGYQKKISICFDRFFPYQ